MKEIIYLNNIIYSKGIIHFMKSIFNLKKEDFSIHICGDYISDEYMNSNQIKISFQNYLNKLLSLGYNITYHGVVDGKRKNELLRKSDIFILPTFYKSEACPLSILEALENNLLIITTNWKYLYDFTDGNLIYLKIKSVNEISDQLIKLKSQSYFRECKKKQSQISIKKITQRSYKKIISSIILKNKL